MYVVGIYTSFPFVVLSSLLLEDDDFSRPAMLYNCGIYPHSLLTAYTHIIATTHCMTIIIMLQPYLRSGVPTSVKFSEPAKRTYGWSAKEKTLFNASKTTSSIITF